MACPPSPAVYFSAGFSGNTYAPGPFLVVPFSTLQAGNLDRSYSTSTATFTAPRDGTYEFGFVMTVFQSSPVGWSAALYVNDTQTDFFSRMRVIPYDDQSVWAAASLSLLRGDAVNVRILGQGNPSTGSFWGVLRDA
jgi:C1q domain